MVAAVGQRVQDQRHAPASVWPRFLALAVDFALFCAVFFPLARLVKGTWLMSAADHRWRHGWVVFDPLCLVFLIIIILYFVLLESWVGATFGKWVLGLRVVRVDGRKPGLRLGLLRNVGRLIDALPALNVLGVVLIATSRDRTRCGDRLAGTRVIHVR